MPGENEVHTVSGGIPTARNIDHMGFTVPNLDEAILFFTNVLGCELLYRVGPWQASEGEQWMATKYSVDPRAVFEAAMLRCGPVTNIELLGWKAPDQQMQMPKNSDVGAAHLAFYVADIDAAVAYLRAQPGVRILDEPSSAPEGPTQGQRSVYVLTPWGMQLELQWFPKGMPYEQKTDARLFGPEPSWKTSEK